MAAGGVRAIFGSSTELFAAFGGVAASFFAWKVCVAVLNMVKLFILGKGIGRAMLLKFKGQWAVVTGATDGIGKEYARQLAEHGLNIVLISRTATKLEAVAKEIESEFKVQTRVIAVDFSKGMSIYDTIRSQLTGLEIGVLVNNVGLSYDYPDYYLEVPDRENVFMNLLNVNCTSVTMMTSIVLSGMVERKKGIVINIASAAGNNATPLLTVYSACKAYVQYLSECLSIEYASKGIIFQSVNPYFVCSNMSKIRRPSSFIPSARTFVESALGTVGQAEKTSGYLPHHMTKVLMDLIPMFLVRKIGMKQLLAARAKYLKKKEAATKKE